MPRPKSTLIVQATTLAVAVILGLALNVFLGRPRPKLLDFSWPGQAQEPAKPSPEAQVEVPGTAPAATPEEAPQDQPRVQAPTAWPEPESRPEQAVSEAAKPEPSPEAEPAPAPAVQPEAMAQSAAPAQPQMEQVPEPAPSPEQPATAGEQATARGQREQAPPAAGPDQPQPGEAPGLPPAGNALTQVDITNNPRELQVLIKTECQVRADKVIYFALKDWGRLVVDFYGDWQIKAETPAIAAGGLAKRVRLSLEPGKLRLVIDLWEKDPAKVSLPSVRRQPQGFLVRVVKAG